MFHNFFLSGSYFMYGEYALFLTDDIHLYNER